MTETRKKYSLVEQEYTTFIRGLVESAVAAPMEGYRLATVAELARAASALIEAREALGRYLEQSGDRLKPQLAPLLDAVDELNFKVDAISARVPDAAPSNGHQDTLAQLREEVRTLFRQLEGSVEGMAQTLPDIPRQLNAQRAASEGLGQQLAGLHARLDEQVRLLISELKQSGQGVAGTTLSIIKETEARLDGRLAGLGEVVVSSAEGVGREIPPLHERLGELNSLAARQQGRLEELARRVEAFQSEAAAGVDATLSGLTQTEQSLGLLMSGHVESAVARIAGGQADASRVMLERTGAVGAEVKESAELIGLEIEETRKSIGAATADARSQLSEQMAKTTDALAASLATLLSGHARTWQEVDGLRARLKELAGDITRTREQLDLLRQTVVKEGAGVASSLKASDEHANQRLQRFAVELTKAFGARFDKQAEEAHSNTARLQAALQSHATELQRVLGASADALRKGLHNSAELSKAIAREGADARTALEIRFDRARVEQQNLKRFTAILFGFTAFSSAGIIAILLYLLFRTIK